jgi:hypothetical protein
MSKEFVQNNYSPGDVVFPKVDPNLKLVISEYLDEIYYCKVQAHPDNRKLVYFERELTLDPISKAKNKKAAVWENEGGAK